MNYSDSEGDSDSDSYYSSEDDEDQIIQNKEYITYHPEVLDITNDCNTSRLSQHDREVISRQYDIPLDQINDQLYEICPDFFRGFESKIEASQYGNLPANFDTDLLDHLLSANDNVLDKGEIDDEDFDILYDNGLIRSPVRKRHTYQYIVKNNFQFPVKIPDNILVMIDKLYKLHPSIQDYISDRTNGNLEDYPFRAPLPNHDILFDLTEANVGKYASDVGMIIPLLYQSSPVIYYVQNVDQYRHVRKGSKLVSRKTDVEIFKHLGVYIPYSSRTYLLNAVDQYLSVNGVEIFTMQHTALLKRAKNKEITTLETLGELIESKERIICIGNSKSFSCFTCSELVQLWNSNFDNAKYQFSLPYDLENEMSDQIYSKLVLLLRCYNMEDEFNSITEIRAKITANYVNLVNGENLRVKEFKAFSSSQQEAIKSFYHLMFECGMYFRHWKGKGHPYPIEASKTEDKHVDPFVMATPHLNHMKDLLTKIEWLRLTPMVNNDSNGYYVTSDTLDNYFRGVYQGSICIRMASTQFIATAERSLRVYASERIPNFDAKDVERIS